MRADSVTLYCDEEGIVDFESVVVFDVHVTPGGSDALLRRTAVAYVTVTFYCRYF
mgnify:CR=1 FL=1